MDGRGKVNFVLVSTDILMVAKAFVRKLLAKEACIRPTAGQALSHQFIARDAAELAELYDQIVMSCWIGRGTKNHIDLRTTLPHEMLLANNSLSTSGQKGSTEIDENISEIKESKRVFVEGKENDCQLIDEEKQRKRRKLVQECFVLC